MATSFYSAEQMEWRLGLKEGTSARLEAKYGLPGIISGTNLSVVVGSAPNKVYCDDGLDWYFHDCKIDLTEYREDVPQKPEVIPQISKPG